MEITLAMFCCDDQHIVWLDSITYLKVTLLIAIKAHPSTEYKQLTALNTYLIAQDIEQWDNGLVGITLIIYRTLMEWSIV